MEISGKRYISTRRAAREHGYHSDYMGQLIRGKKVVGQKVGRAWYIEEGSLNAYLGLAAPEPIKKEAPQEAQVVEISEKPAVVERLVVEEPEAAPVVAAPAPVEQQAEPAQEARPVQIEQQTPARAIYNEPFVPPVATPSAPVAQAQHVSYTAPRVQAEQETRILIHTVPAYEHAGGLRYADDDTPSIPVVMSMPQEPVYYQAPQPKRAHAAGSTFPYVSLSVVAVVSIVGALFASNFITATIVSEEGKAASVQYSIHW